MNRNGWSDAQLMATMADAVSCISEKDAMETRKNMVNAGFKQLGNGNFAAAFTRPDMKGYVIKITKGNDNFPAYVYWALANPGPAIPEYKFPFLSTIELKNNWSGDIDRQFAVMMPAYVSNSYIVGSDPDYNMAVSILRGYGQDGDLDAPLASAAIEMKQFFGHSVNWDLHANNVMIDPLDKSLKITDPFCGPLDYHQLAQLTGRSYEQQQEPTQLDLQLLGMGRDRVWPRPAYADRVAKVAMPKARGVGRLPHVPALGKQGLVGMKFDPQIIADLVNFGDVEQRFQHAFAGGLTRKMGLKPVMIDGRQAIKQELSQLGHFLQGEDLMKRFRAGQKDIEICLAPSLPPALRLNKNFDPLAVIQHKRVRLSLAQAEFLQAQYNVAKQNRDRANFGKGWRPPVLQL